MDSILNLTDTQKVTIIENVHEYYEGKITLDRLAEEVGISKQDLRDYLQSINLDNGISSL